MRLRAIHVATSDGIEYVFWFLVDSEPLEPPDALPTGVSFELIEAPLCGGERTME
jgi:hypothetical protein